MSETHVSEWQPEGTQAQGSDAKVASDPRSPAAKIEPGSVFIEQQGLKLHDTTFRTKGSVAYRVTGVEPYEDDSNSDAITFVPLDKEGNTIGHASTAVRRNFMRLFTSRN